MKKTYWLLALTLVLVAAGSQAQAWGWPGAPYRVDGGIKIWLNLEPLGPQPQLAPWYLYFPYEPQFQTPSSSGYYPHWPMPGVQGMYQAPAPMPTPTSAVRPASFYYPSAPSYWYQR